MDQGEQGHQARPYSRGLPFPGLACIFCAPNPARNFLTVLYASVHRPCPLLLNHTSAVLAARSASARSVLCCRLTSPTVAFNQSSA